MVAERNIRALRALQSDLYAEERFVYGEKLVKEEQYNFVELLKYMSCYLAISASIAMYFNLRTDMVCKFRGTDLC